jgi:hypothetical protein
VEKKPERLRESSKQPTKVDFCLGSSKKITEVAFCFHLESSSQNIDDFIMIPGPLFAAASPGILQRGGIAKSRVESQYSPSLL